MPESVQYTVDAKPPPNAQVDAWHNSGVVIQQYQNVKITYKSGEWTANPATGMVTAFGNSQYKAKPGYSMPGENEGALIGRIGMDGAPFLVGLETEFTSSVGGTLYLIINDDLPPLYGAGTVDNQGSVIVEIECS